MIPRLGPRREKVETVGDTVLKTVHGSVDEVAEKYQAIWRVSKKVPGAFSAPRVLGADAERNAVVLERLPDVHSIREVYLDFMIGTAPASTAEAVFHQAGHVLALLHQNLWRPDAARWHPPHRFKAALKKYGMAGDVVTPFEPVQLHGDYGFANVLCRSRDGEALDLVIIDPCQDGYSTETDWCLGPRYVDIGKMLLSAEGKVPLVRQPLVRRRKVRLVQSWFLGGYSSVRDVNDEVDVCFAYAYGLAACYFGYRFAVGGALATGIIYNRFRRNFPLAAKLRFHQGSHCLTADRQARP